MSTKRIDDSRASRRDQARPEEAAGGAYASHIRKVVADLEDAPTSVIAADEARVDDASAVQAPSTRRGLRSRRSVGFSIALIAVLATAGAGIVAVRSNDVSSGSDGPPGAAASTAPSDAGAAMVMDTGPEMSGVLSQTFDSKLEMPIATFDAPGSHELQFQIVDAAGEPLTSFEIEATKPLHMIVVRDDLSTFEHLHPTLASDGTWTTTATFDTAGTYRMYADFAPEGKGRRVLGMEISVGGASGSTPIALPAVSKTALANGDVITIDRSTFVAGEMDTLAVTITSNGTPVDDLQPYLGMSGHGVIINDKSLAYQHTHPVSKGSGPRLEYMVNFTEAGTYRAFLQYKRGGKIHTVGFTITADKAAANAAGSHSHMDHDMAGM